MAKFKLSGSIDYPDVGVITDEEVYQVVRKHSRIRDRLNARKVIEMAQYAQLILMKEIDYEGLRNNSKWKFYGKNGLLGNG